MTWEELCRGRAERLVEMAKERLGGEKPTMLDMPLGAEFGREIRPSDLDTIRELHTKITSDAISPDPSYERWKTWMYMFGIPYSATPAKTTTIRSLPPFKKRNEDWDRILAGLNHVGRPSGEGEFMRPTGEWVTDLTKSPNGYEFMEAAHVLAHARALAKRKSVQDMRYRGFLETLSELVIAKRYRLTVKVPTLEEIVAGEDNCHTSSFDMNGIRPVVSTNMRKPWLIAGMQNGCLTLFRDSVIVLVGIHLEPQPWSSREDNPNAEDDSWLEMNRWSCMPSIVSISGWVGIDELSKAPVVSRNEGQDISTGSFVMPVTALDGPSTLDVLMARKEEPDKPENGIWHVDRFLESDWLQRLKRVVAPLPCRDCLRLNMSAEGAPTKPASKRPDPDDKRDTEAAREWKEYDAKIDKIVNTVQKACDFYECRFVHPEGGGKMLRERRRNAKFVSEALERIESNTKRSKSLATKGFSDKASKLNGKSKELIGKIENILKGGNG